MEIISSYPITQWKSKNAFD